MVVFTQPYLKGNIIDFYRLKEKIEEWLKATKPELALAFEGLGQLDTEYWDILNELSPAYVNAIEFINTYKDKQPTQVDVSTAKFTLSMVNDLQKLAMDIYNYTHSGPQPYGNLIKRGHPDRLLVSKLQKLLYALGYYPGPIDGIFGPKTEAAVKAFQKDVGLVPDGIVGNNTSSALLNKVRSLAGNGNFLASAFNMFKQIVTQIWNSKLSEQLAKAKAYELLYKMQLAKKQGGGSMPYPQYPVYPWYPQGKPTEEKILGLPKSAFIALALVAGGLFIMEMEKRK